MEKKTKCKQTTISTENEVYTQKEREKENQLEDKFASFSWCEQSVNCNHLID